jgi:hypothetical protein
LFSPTSPYNTESFDGELATYWFDNDGILISVSKKIKRTLENTTANFTLVKQITKNKKVPLLIYLTKSAVPSKQTRKFVAEVLPTVYTAMAMVSKSRIGKMVINVLFKLKPPPIPMKTFASDKEAKQWLKQYL